MNWRIEIRKFFEEAVSDSLACAGLQSFDGFNSQMTYKKLENFATDFNVLFMYSSIGGGSHPYLRTTGYKTAEHFPVTVTLVIVFRDFTDHAQVAAYDYANAVCERINGSKHTYVHGQIYKTGEVEDFNHDALYSYTMTFGFNVLQFYTKETVEVSPRVDISIKID